IEIARVGASQVRKACSGSADRASSRICDQTSEAVSSMNSREEQRDFWVRRTRQARPRLWKSQPENRSLPAPPNTATEHGRPAREGRFPEAWRGARSAATTRGKAFSVAEAGSSKAELGRMILWFRSPVG